MKTAKTATEIFVADLMNSLARRGGQNNENKLKHLGKHGKRHDIAVPQTGCNYAVRLLNLI